MIFEKHDNRPWLDIRLPENAMDHLWDSINTPISHQQEQETDARGILAGNISKSRFIQDKNNWFFKNALQQPLEYVFYRETWSNYFDIIATKLISPPVFKLDDMWVNYQKQHEFNPPHNHGGIFSFVVFMKIPTHWKEQHALPFSANTNAPVASDFEFLLGTGTGPVELIQIPLSPKAEGRMLFFPAWLVHQVFPFYECEEERITVSGNMSIQQQPGKTTSQSTLDKDEYRLERLERQIKALKQNIQITKNERKYYETEKNSERS